MNTLASLAHPPQRRHKENVASARDTLAQASHLLLDLDGTLVRQNEAIDGAAELLARFEGRFAIVSNNSTHTAQGLSLRLRRLGLRVPPGRIVLAGECAVELLARQQPGARVMVVGSAALQRLATGRGLRPVTAEAEVVLLALDLRFSHARLSAVVHELRSGARLLVANADTSHPGPQGRLVPETGALLAAVEAASGVRPWRVVGKPEPLLFEQGLRRLDADPARTLVVGDNPATDAAGAARLGLACVLVGDAAGAQAASVAELAALPLEPVRLSSA